MASPMAMPCWAWMKATSSTMKTPGSRISCQLVGGRFGALDPIAAAVESPRAAKRTVPGAAPAELDGGTRVEHADEVLAAVPQQVAGGRPGRRGSSRSAAAGPSPSAVTTPGTSSSAGRSRFRSLRAVALRTLTLAFDHAADGTLAVLQQVPRDERCAVAAGKDKCAGANPRGELGELDHFGHVRQIIARDGDRIRLPFAQQAFEVLGRLDLKIDQPNVVPAPRAAAAISSIPSGSSRRKILEYIRQLGDTARIFMSGRDATESRIPTNEPQLVARNCTVQPEQREPNPFVHFSSFAANTKRQKGFPILSRLTKSASNQDESQVYMMISDDFQT